MITTIVRKLPSPVEFCLVVIVCSWWAIYANIMAIRSWSTPSQAQERHAGIGIELGEKDNKVIIVQALPNTPAAKAGLSRGLVIQKIDGTSTDGKSLKDCAALGHGLAGSKVKYELVDLTEDKTNTVELIREGIQGAPRPHSTDKRALKVAIYEFLGLAAMFWIARARKWPLGAWGFRPSWRLTGAGILLFLVITLSIQAIAAFANSTAPGTVHSAGVSLLSLPVLVLFAVTNSTFEETLEIGYFFQSFQRYGMWSAVLASAFFRAFLHSYHGMTALIIILPFGLIFGFIYWKWRRLWPLYIAHLLFDLAAYFPR